MQALNQNTSIITLKVRVLNTPIKKDTVRFFICPNYMLSTRNLLQI